MGLGALVVEDAAPSLSGMELLAVAAWNWCGGWFPERLPLYLALHPVDDVEALCTLLLSIRDTVNNG